MASMPTKDTSPTVSTLLRKVNRDIDIDLAITVADVMNVYNAALARCANRTTLGPEDSIRVLHIINQIIDACDGKAEPEISFAARSNGRDAAAPSNGQ
jgi:hypothetical protein